MSDSILSPDDLKIFASKFDDRLNAANLAAAGAVVFWTSHLDYPPREFTAEQCITGARELITHHMHGKTVDQINTFTAEEAARISVESDRPRLYA